LGFGWVCGLGVAYYVAMGLIFFALIVEHVLCQSGDLAKINIAFFNMNALVGLILVIGVGVSVLFSPMGSISLIRPIGPTEDAR